MFVDFNQNAKDRTVASAYSIRPLPDARVSTPLDWDEVRVRRPEEFTVPTVLERFAEIGDPHAGIDDAVGTLDGLLALATELGPAEKPPRGGDGSGRRQSAMPLIEVARTKTKPEALAALDEWKTAASRTSSRPCIPPTCSSTACAARARSGTGCGSTCSTSPKRSARRRRSSSPTTTRGPARSGRDAAGVALRTLPAEPERTSQREKPRAWRSQSAGM